MLIEKAKKMAGHVLEASAGDIEFADGKFTVVGTDKSIALVDLARQIFAPVGWPAEFGVGLEAVGTFTPTRSNFANGCHICEVEVDPDTGAVEIVRYIGVDDFGIIINPLLFEGQIHGGLAMGIGQALLEHVAFDDDIGADSCPARSWTIACRRPSTSRRSRCTTCPTAAATIRSA